MSIGFGDNTWAITGVTLTAGAQYTIGLGLTGTEGTLSFACNVPDSYPGGSFTISATNDLVFKTFMESGNPVVVTDQGRVGVGLLRSSTPEGSPGTRIVSQR